MKFGRVAWAVAVRLVCALTAATLYVPDEHWQSREVAHHMVFGEGYLTWEWHRGLRSVAFPLIYAIPFYVLKQLHLDSAYTLDLAVRGVGVCFAVILDWSTAKLATRLFDKRVGQYTFLLSLSSMFNWFSSTRSIANAVEASLCAAAVSVWPWNDTRRGKETAWLLSLILAALTCMIRPTNAVIWLVLVGLTLVSHPGHGVRLIKRVCVVGAGALGVLLGMDRLYYGHWQLTPLHFVQFNLVQGLSSFYGEHPWHWYITQGVPVMFGTQLVLLLPGVYYGAHHSPATRHTLLVALTYIAVFSMLGHKEFRFLYPVLPLLLPFAGFGVDWCRHRLSPGWRRGLTWMLLWTQLLPGVYLNSVHQRGVVDVMQWLSTASDVTRVVFLMPCHSTPFRAAVHRPVHMQFLTCEPPLHSTRTNHVDQADQFYTDPLPFLDMLPWPSHVILFEALLTQHPQVSTRLTALQYTEVSHVYYSADSA